MINFPIFDQLDILEYGLYPGESPDKPGLHIQFQPGLTLILGANGLGKSTLVTILYRLLAGPFEIRGISSTTTLGGIRLTPTRLSSKDRATFAQRVSDNARKATASLSFRLGDHRIVIERNLSDLKLTHFSIDGRQLEPLETESFHIEIPKLVGVWSFGDWILVLRHLVFYFEDRRALVWDPTAQRQILRLLFLPAEIARKWSQDERIILELDSRARNLRAVVFREEQALVDTESMVEKGADVHSELITLEELQQIDIEQRERLDSELIQTDSRRQQARLRMLTVEQDRETRFREMERAKLTAIEARFPRKSETARFILAQLMVDANCLVCGNHVPGAAATLEQRIANELCVVCGSDLSHSSQHIPPSTLADQRVEKATGEFHALAAELTEAQHQLKEVENEHGDLLRRLAELDSEISNRSARIDLLIQRLPPAEAELRKKYDELASLRSSFEIMLKELSKKRQTFATFIENESRKMVELSNAIRTSFAQYAKGFLIEECDLVWSPHLAEVGQGGARIEFPNFELDMTGSSFTSPVRRSGPDQVSESQREFIDLSFRMSLIQVAGSGGAGSIVIDAPESSLDAVFVTRAADVLARFALHNRENRLVVTSNVIEGKLLPTLLERASSVEDPASRVINLFEIAEPTAATRELEDEYERIIDQLLDSISANQEVSNQQNQTALESEIEASEAT